MFRSRKSLKNEIVQTSSLSSGNASIQRPTTPPVVVTEPFYTNEPVSYHKDEVIDLQAPTQQDLTIESMSAVIAAAVLMSSSKGGSPSSLSLGNASILKPSPATPTAENTKGRSRFFSNPWKKNTPTSPTHSLPATPGLEPSSPFDSTSSITVMDDDNSSQGSPRTSSSASGPDDGRDELLYRGIQIKEIKTTLKTLVISDEARYPMPEVRLERPGFARINY